MNRTFVLAAALVAALPAIGMAQGNGNGNGNPHGAGPQGQFCPPGLANRDPACVPPGQARHGDGTVDDDDIVHVIGDIIDIDRIHWITDWPDRDLAVLPDGLAYALVDNNIVVIDRQTLALVELIRLLD